MHTPFACIYISPSQEKFLYKFLHNIIPVISVPRPFCHHVILWTQTEEQNKAREVWSKAIVLQQEYFLLDKSEKHLIGNQQKKAWLVMGEK